MDFLNNSKKKQVNLRGSSKQESSRAEDLLKAKEDRAARKAAKREQAAALTVQRVWRGACARQVTRQELCVGWIAKYGRTVSNQEDVLCPQIIADEVLPPVLLAMKVPGALHELQSCTMPVALTKDSAAFRGALALVLRCLGATHAGCTLFALALDISSRPHLLSLLKRLAALCCSVIGSPSCDILTQLAAARVLSLLTNGPLWQVQLQEAAQAQHSYEPAPACSPPPSVGDSTPAPGVTAAAALQGVPGAWMEGAAAWGPAVAAVGSMERGKEAFLWVLHQWLSFMAASPMVVHAVRRLAELARAPCSSQRLPPALGLARSEAAGAQELGLGPGVAASRGQLISMLSTLTQAQLRLWQQLSCGGGKAKTPCPARVTPYMDTVVPPNCPSQRTSLQHGIESAEPGSSAIESARKASGEQHGRSGGELSQHGQRALGLLTTQVLTLPNLLTLLSLKQTAQLTDPATFIAVLDAVPKTRAETAACSVYDADPHAPVSGVPDELGRDDALWLLANLTGLMAGKKVKKGGTGGSAGSTAVSPPGGPAPSSPSGRPAVEYLPPTHLLSSTSTSRQLAMHFTMVATMLLRWESTPAEAPLPAGAALQALWPFAEGSFATQLLSLLPLELFTKLYHVLLTTLDAASASRPRSSSLTVSGVYSTAGPRSASATGQGNTTTTPHAAPKGATKQGGTEFGSTTTTGGEPTQLVHSVRVLSALAFATPLLPRLWKSLSASVGFPGEGPAQATRGWDIPTLGLGIHSVDPAAAEGLGLFCRVYVHYLMVTDDLEFHDKQPLFTLGTQRAIAATLNTLIFRTHLPAQHPQHTQQGRAGVQYNSKGMQYGMLAEQAPILLRAMYERDARRGFCPPQLWLEPYQRTVNAPTPPAHMSTPAHHSTSTPASTSARHRQGTVGESSQSGGDGGRLRGLLRGLTRGLSREAAQAPGAARGVSQQPEALYVHGWFEGSQGEGGRGASGGWQRLPAPPHRHHHQQQQLAGSRSSATEVDSGFSAAAVVRALLLGQEPEAGRHSSHSMHASAGTEHGVLQQGPHTGRHAALSAASQPSALAAILLAAPQCVPFQERVSVFRALVDMDKERGGYHLAPVDGGPRPQAVTIRRGYVLEDALTQLPRSGDALKARLHVTFVNSQGLQILGFKGGETLMLQEAGVDMGGLMKELVELVVQQGCDVNRGLFSATAEGYAYPNPLAEQIEGGLAVLELLGAVLGKALYEGILVDLPLAPFLLSRLQGRWPLFDELADLDPEVYRSLVQLKRYEGNVEDLALDFTVESDCFGTRVSEELTPGGTSVAVTATNVLQYVFLVADWHLNKRLGVAARAFGRGLAKVIPPSWLRLFSPSELNQLLGGGEGGDIDVADMIRYTQYSGGYSPSCSAVKMFWRVVEGLGQDERHALLKFVTSCSRAPLGGFRHLNPPLTIHQVECDAAPFTLLSGKDVDRLPSASTCYNMLKLPNYRKVSTMREKLLYAIHSGAGFELS